MVEVNNKKLYIAGLKTGLPIAFVYFIVSFTFGITVVNYGMPWWYATLISATNLTSAGQFAGVNLIAIAASFIEIALTVMFVNLRYIFMGFSLSQKFDPNIGYFKRLIMSLFITDEIFAVSITRGDNLKFSYFIGLATAPYFGWALGTLTGALANSVLPTSLQAACGVALYCMFIAIIVPPATKSKPIILTIAISIAVSCLFYYTPYLKEVSLGFRIIIATFVASVITSIFFPIDVDKQNRESKLEEYKNTLEYVYDANNGGEQ